MFRHLSRRTVLRRGTAVATIAATGALTGCQRALLRGVDVGRPESTETVRKWSPAPPDEKDGSENESPRFSISYLSPKTLSNVNRRTDNNLLRGSKRAFQERIAPLEVPFETVPFTLEFGHHTTVIRYKHDQKEVASTLDREGFQSQSEHRGFEVYAGRKSGDIASQCGQEMERILAFDGEHVVNTRCDRTADRESTPWFELVIDAKAGANDRYVAVDDHMKDLLGTAQPGDILNLSRNGTLSALGHTVPKGAFEGLARQCFSGRFAASTAEFQFLFEFASVDDADPSAVKQYVESQREEGNGFLDAKTIAYEEHGRQVEVTYEVPLEDL